MSKEKLLQQFGTTPISSDLIERLELITGHPAHPFLKRGIFFSCRDLDVILDAFVAKKSIYIYTGRGPSAGSFHLGHLVPFLFTVYLQKIFNAQVVIQITDDEKFTHRQCSMEQIHSYTKENVRDIVACGFDPDKTFIFNNLDYISHLYKNVVMIQSKISNKEVFSTFGLKMSDNIGKTSFCAMQIAPVMPSTFSHIKTDSYCLVPCGIDQDPYFRLARDVCPKLKVHKPSLMHCSFVPSLQGIQSKMSSSLPETAIFVTDTPQQIKKKIAKSVSGGHVDREEQISKGADLTVDIPFTLLTYFLDNQGELDEIQTKYGNESDHYPKMLTSQVKDKAYEVVLGVIAQHQARKKLVTEDFIKKFTSIPQPL